MEMVRSEFERTRDHWWWRPGWAPGARFATFHLTFERAPELQAEAARCGHMLSGIEHVDVIPPEWLHLTMTGIGFTDAIATDALRRISDAVFEQVVPLTRPLAFNQLALFPEALVLAADSAPWLDQLIATQEWAIGRELGGEPQAERRFWPHVSLAYFSGEVDLPTLERAIAQVSPQPVAVEQPMLSLIELGRDDQVYTWQVLAQRPLRD